LSLNPAKVRVEIFRESGFFDDNFCKGWTLITGLFTRNGDIIEITGYSEVGRAEKNLPNLDTNIYTKIECRVTAIGVSPTIWGIKVYDDLTSTWLTIWTGQIATGLFEVSLPLGKTLTKIALLEEYVGNYTNYVDFDYVAICKNSLLVPDLGDLVEELTVTRPLLNNAINGAKLTIPNFAGAYNDYIKGHDAILIWLARDEANLGTISYKVFGGRVISVTNRGEKYGAFYIDLDCHGHAYEADIPPALLQKVYSATNGRTIIGEALALCNYLAQHPDAHMWFDWSGAYGSTDDRIGSTHDVAYDEENPMTIIQEILEKAKNPAAVQGFDAYETPSGVLVGHLRNSLDFVSPITSITPESYQKSEDLHRVRNKIKVYGMQAKMLGDLAEALTNWTTDETGPTQDGSDVKEGSCSIVATTAGDQSIMLNYHFTSPISCKFSHQYRKLHLWVKVDAGSFNAGAYFNIQLRTGSGIDYFRKIVEIPHKGQWMELELEIGPDTEWVAGSGADWENINDLRIGFSNAPTSSNLTLKVDGVRFIKNFEYTAEDSVSQQLYGIRMNKPIVDESLKSDAECQARAESILAVLKDPAVTLSEVVVDGEHRYNPGDRQRIVVGNDGLDAYFCIIQVKHSVKGTQWDAVLTLSNEPQYVDYVFKLLQEAQKLLERRA
jgi:hypothetical protein